ncbi:hypothetical protein H2248_002778 [Termitomyces sp. 'cryptogamus']|nr:hypothetical protein H2248_002778 [Termitomyces sp. 'cryptogamus']
MPVIPDMLDGDEGIQLINFGSPGFVPISIVKTNTSEGSSQSTAESDRRYQGRRAAGGGVGSRIYGAPASTTSGPGVRSLYAPPQTQMPKTQIYGDPSTSASQRQRQTPRQAPQQIYSSMSVSGSAGSGSGSNIYAQARPSSRISNIYAPPTSGTAPQQMFINTSILVPVPHPPLLHPESLLSILPPLEDLHQFMLPPLHAQYSSSLLPHPNPCHLYTCQHQVQTAQARCL